MAQFYTLEEAARVLGISPEDLKHKAQQREVRAFLDSGSWRFRVADIDELARKRGMGSDPDLSLSDLELVSQGDDALDLSEFSLGTSGPDLAHKTMSGSPILSDEDIMIDDASLPPGPPTNSSSTILGMEHAGKLPSDSDVRLVPDLVRDASDSDVKVAGVLGASDSDVKLSPDGPSKVGRGRPSDSDVTLVSDDDIALLGKSSSSDALPPVGKKPGDTAIRPGSSADMPKLKDTDDSDFELTPSSVIDALQPESGSDFELTALDVSEEFEATPLRGPGDSDLTGGGLAAAGINMAKPSDSGINLTSIGGLDLDQAESIELAPLSGDDIPAVKPSKSPAAKKPARPSPAETPVPAARAEKDIFASSDTDFELDLRGGEKDDQTVQLEAQSDFELEANEPSSEVFALDEEDVDQNAATAMGPAVLEDDEDEDDGFGAAVGAATAGAAAGAAARGRGRAAAAAPESAWDVDAVESGEVSSASRGTPVLSREASAEWGGLWVGLLAGSTVIMLLLAGVAFDLVRNMNDWRGPTPVASGLVKGIAGLFG